MRSDYTGHVTASEWRWVIWVSAFLIILAFTPFLWIVLRGITNTEWAFMGVIHEYENGASHLSRISQGREGQLLARFLHTPEPHDGTFFDVVYPIIGQASRLIRLPVGVTFHIARVAASIFMYMSLYYLASMIWMRVRSRRIFFSIAIGGTGFGWILGVLSGDASYLDLTAPEVFPFFSSLANVHFPLTIGCMAFLISVIIRVFRPGASQEPTVNNEGLLIFILGLILIIIYPLALIPIIIAFTLIWLLRCYANKTLVRREAYWLLWFAVPTLPFILYYSVILAYNPIVGDIWRQANTIIPPTLFVFVLSLGLPLIVALPGIIRVVKRFEPDGDQFMFIWLFVIISLIYLPTEAQRRFSIGLMIPIAYFATRALEDFWFNLIIRRWRYRVLAILIPVMATSHLFILYLPTRPIATNNIREAQGMVLEDDYIDALDWLDQETNSNDVILASPITSLWIPVATGSRVVYGHPVETADNDTKHQAVIGWYTATNNTSDICNDVLTGAYYVERSYNVSYVIDGPQERALGASACFDNLELQESFGVVNVYSTSTLNQP